MRECEYFRNGSEVQKGEINEGLCFRKENGLQKGDEGWSVF